VSAASSHWFVCVAPRHQSFRQLVSPPHHPWLSGYIRLYLACSVGLISASPTVSRRRHTTELETTMSRRQFGGVLRKKSAALTAVIVVTARVNVIVVISRHIPLISSAVMNFVDSEVCIY